MLLRRLPRIVPLYPVLGILGACAHAITIVPECNSSIYCNGELLKKVQLARLYPDSKTFVDMKLNSSQNETLAEFSKLMEKTKQNPTPAQLATFVQTHFSEGNELEQWHPADFDPAPPILDEITDPKLKQFAKDVIAIWPQLGRIVTAAVSQNPDNYSFMYVPNGFLVPGGRFKELYYWDSYWIIRGLILSNMPETAKGMIENFLHLVNTLGYIPNGNRIYYLGRSQPPLLTAMVASYVEASGDYAWLKCHITTIEKELQYWLERKTVTVKVNEKKYVLLRHLAHNETNGPRPESYYEDYISARNLSDDFKREKYYQELKSAAETGWDFSTRWFITADGAAGDRLDVHATRIVPVDTNAIFAAALQQVGDFRDQLHDSRQAKKWWSLAKYWRSAIDNVLWDPIDGVWYDYDIKDEKLRKSFYPSCVAPLWAQIVDENEAPEYAARLVKYLQKTGALDFPGGVPASLLHSGEQWDFPNGWPPLQSIMIIGLDSSGHKEAQKIAKELATVWIRSNYIGYNMFQKFFEKYSVEQPGHMGGGGEYNVQAGFGWTNGVVLELLQKYGSDVSWSDSVQSSLPDVRQV